LPRQARIRAEGYPLHVIQRGNNRGPCFVHDRDRILYLSLLEEFGHECECHLHAYVLMTNHVHLLVSPVEARNVSQFMKDVAQRYAQYFNRSYKRTGSLWEGRFRSSIVDSEAYLLRCQRYIELNPVRAGMVAHPLAYAWSSYLANAEGDECSIVRPHPVYLALNSNAGLRRAAYRKLFDAPPSARELEEIRAACRGGFVLGRPEFIADLEKRLGRRIASSHESRVRRREVCPTVPRRGTCGLSPV
jgi:REP-associated tyrosine transposase